MVFAKFKLSPQQVEEIVEQLKENYTEMDNCLSDYALNCFELFRVSESKNIQILYWIRIIKVDDNNYELQFIREIQTSW